MKRRHILLWTLLMVSLGLVCAQVVFAADDPLPSWQDGAPKRAIVDFVTRVTCEAGADFIRPAERIATFDNDGTLWVEQSMYVGLEGCSIASRAFK